MGGSAGVHVRFDTGPSSSATPISLELLIPHDNSKPISPQNLPRSNIMGKRKTCESGDSRPLDCDDTTPLANPNTPTDTQTRSEWNLRKRRALNPTRYAFGVTFVYDECKIRDVCGCSSWPTFFDKFVGDFTAMKFNGSVPPMQRAERLSNSQIFAYWLSSGKNAHDDAHAEWQLWRNFLESSARPSSPDIDNTARECGIRKLYVHKVSRINGDAWDWFPEDYLRDFDDNDVLVFETSGNDHIHAKVEESVPTDFTHQKEATVKREELDRQPFKILDSASNNLQVERKHVQVDINVRQNPRRKRSSQRPANRTSESVLKKRSVKDELYSPIMKKTMLRKGDASGTTVDKRPPRLVKNEGSLDLDINGSTRKAPGNAVAGIAVPTMSRNARRKRNRRLRKEFQKLALRQPVLLIDSSSRPLNTPQALTIGEYLAIMTESVLVLDSSV